METSKTVKNCSGNFIQIYQYLFELFLTLTWISPNYQSSLKFSENQVQNFNHFFEKFTQIVFIIYSSFLEIVLKFFKISAKLFRIFVQFFFQNFNKYYWKLILFSNFCFIFWTFPQPLLKFVGNDTMNIISSLNLLMQMIRLLLWTVGDWTQGCETRGRVARECRICQKHYEMLSKALFSKFWLHKI